MKKAKLWANPMGRNGLFTLREERAEENGQQIYLWTKDFEPQEIRKCDVLCNEEGIIKGLPINEMFEGLYDIKICGNIILLEVEEV